MYFSERILWHTSKAVQCWLVLEWFHIVICHLYGVIRTIIKSFLYIYTHQYLYTCIVIVCEHGLRIAICCALSNKELLLLLLLYIANKDIFHWNTDINISMQISCNETWSWTRLTGKTDGFISNTKHGAELGWLVKLTALSQTRLTGKTDGFISN
jgi:hypothetical protein